MTPDEAQAVIRLWSRRQWEREHWPTVADVAEGLGIPVEEAAMLLGEIRTHPSPVKNDTPSVSEPPPPPASGGWRICKPGGFRLAAGMAGLTGFFCLYLERLLS